MPAPPRRLYLCPVCACAGTQRIRVCTCGGVWVYGAPVSPCPHLMRLYSVCQCIRIRVGRAHAWGGGPYLNQGASV